MFKKIISTLPFSPALVGQLGFYAKRLRQEEITRKLAFIFIALTLVVQSLAILQPAESANASSDNDMVTGGISSISEFLSNYDSNTKNLHDIMNYAGITRQEIANATYGSWQIGDTLSWGLLPKFSYDQGERQRSVNLASGGTTTVYSRPLKLWSTSTKTVYGWIGNSSSLGWFAILQGCGNLITTTVPQQTVDKPDDEEETVDLCDLNDDLLASDKNCKPCPGDDSIWIKDPICKANIVKIKSASNISQGNVNATTVIANTGDRISFTLSIENTGLNSDTATFEDNLVDTLEYATIVDTGGGTFDSKTKTLTWPTITLTSGNKQTRTFTIKILDEIPSTATGKSDNTSYDCKILNTFGSSLVINVNCPVVKIVEQVTAELPRTGPTENIIFSCIVLAVAAYFFTRTKQCQKCGWNALCNSCFIPMSLHTDKFCLTCHACGKSQPVPVSCPICHDANIVHKGIGTKLIESEITKLFPDAVIARFDNDNKDSETIDQKYQDIYDGKINIIIGTQVVAKGLDLPNLRTVCVIQADSGLALPDYNSNERAFQLIAQVVGRVGRNEHKTNVIIQTYQPNHSSIIYGLKQDYESFYEDAINERRRSHFPPFVHLLKFNCAFKTEAAAIKSAKEFAVKLKNTVDTGVTILGPMPSFYERLNGKYHWQIILKSPKREYLIKAIKLLPKNNWQFELEPTSLLK